jgi:hypothetical protein
MTADSGGSIHDRHRTRVGGPAARGRTRGRAPWHDRASEAVIVGGATTGRPAVDPGGIEWNPTTGQWRHCPDAGSR